MELEQLEAEVLALPKGAQIELLARLLKYLGQTAAVDQEIAEIWVEEADFRDRSMEIGETVGIPAEVVFQRVRASLQ